jgi:hypothetical protein
MLINSTLKNVNDIAINYEVIIKLLEKISLHYCYLLLFIHFSTLICIMLALICCIPNVLQRF